MTWEAGEPTLGTLYAEGLVDRLGEPADPGIYRTGPLERKGELTRYLDVAASLQAMLEEAEFVDQLGLDVFAIGEHHRKDFLVSAPAVVLAAIAARTTRASSGSRLSGCN